MQVKTFCGGQWTTEQVKRALLKIFGPDHTPNIKDMQKVHRTIDKDTAEAHDTTDADRKHKRREDDERNYPDEGYSKESYFVGDFDGFTFRVIFLRFIQEVWRGSKEKRVKRGPRGRKCRAKTRSSTNLWNMKDSNTRWHTFLSRVGAGTASGAQDKGRLAAERPRRNVTFPRFTWSTCALSSRRREARWRSWSQEREGDESCIQHGCAEEVDGWLELWKIHGVASRDRTGDRERHRDVRHRTRADELDRVVEPFASDEVRFTDDCREPSIERLDEERNSGKCHSASSRHDQKRFEVHSRQDGGREEGVGSAPQFATGRRTRGVLVAKVRSRQRW